MRNAELEEAQAGIKIAGRNINNLRYADDTTLMAESEKEQKSLLMKLKVEREKVGLKLNIQRSKIIPSGSITSWQIDGEMVETGWLYFLGGSKITADGDCSHEIKRFLLLGRKVMANLDSILKSWHSNTLPTWCEELTHWKRLWCWERLRARGEGDDRGWDYWMASSNQWTWVWVDSRSWWWTRRPGVLWFMGWGRKESEMTEWLNRTELNVIWGKKVSGYVVSFR